MATVVDYETYKRYLRLDDDSERERIIEIAEGIEAMAAKYIETDLPDPLPFDIRLGLCKALDDEIKNSGSFITGTILTELPNTLRTILNPYRSSEFIG